MANNETPIDETPPEAETPPVEPDIHVAPSSHLSETTFTTRRMMVDVLLGLAPAMLMALIVFGWYAVVQVGLCVLFCLGAEALFNRMRSRPLSIWDCSAVITGVILGMSLPWSAPWYVAAIGSLVAIGLGKAAFGGLGFNIFNPAMVGRAFVMLSFPKALGASAYVALQEQAGAITQATPLTMAKKVATEVAAGKALAGEAAMQVQAATKLWPAFVGQVNGSLGETSALALLIGGLYLCARRAASWEIPAGVLASTFVLATLSSLLGLTPFSPFHHFVCGALFLGAFFIATDPVTSPVTPRGKFVFGLGVGAFVVLIRIFSGYPEGLMFAILLMNAMVPLINRWTVPVPVGGLPPGPS